MEAAFNFISFALFLSFIIFIHTQWKKKTKTSGKLLPGPQKLPIIGNLHQLSVSQPTHRVLAELAKKYGFKGLMHLQIGELSTVVVSSPEMAKEFLRTHDLGFATRPESLASNTIFYNSSDIVFSRYGDYWRQMRKICVTELLNAKTVRSFSSIRHDEIHRLLADVRSSFGQPVNLSERIYVFVSSIICRSAFGTVFTGREEFIEQVKEIMTLLVEFDFADVFPSWKVLNVLCGNKKRIMKAHRKTDAIIENIIKEHRKKLGSGNKGSGELGADCFVDVLLRLMNNESLQVPITHDNIKAVILDMFGAGSDTSTTTTLWAMSEMMKNPRVLAKAQNEVREAFRGKEMLDEDDVGQLPYLKSVIKESLRCYPPAPLLFRECSKETMIGGYTILPKTKVTVNTWAIGRDPEHWEDPESFIPERFDNNSVDFMGNDFEFLPFGAGRRICPGLSFGFANALSPVAHLLYHFDWKLPPGITVDSFDMTEMSGLTVGRKNDLFLIPTSPVA